MIDHPNPGPEALTRSAAPAPLGCVQPPPRSQPTWFRPRRAALPRRRACSCHTRPGASSPKLSRMCPSDGSRGPAVGRCPPEPQALRSEDRPRGTRPAATRPRSLGRERTRTPTFASAAPRDQSEPKSRGSAPGAPANRRGGGPVLICMVGDPSANRNMTGVKISQ